MGYQERNAWAGVDLPVATTDLAIGVPEAMTCYSPASSSPTSLTTGRSSWDTGGWRMDKVDIRNRIREFRFKTEEMTQQALADRVGITRQTVIALEKGKYFPSLELAFRIAKTFDVPLEEVFQVVE